MASPETKAVVTATENEAEEITIPKKTTPQNSVDVVHEVDPDIENKCFSVNSNSPTSYNPHLPDGEENDVLERLRGDAIGSTLYSERFVISTLLNLREMKKSLESDEKFERDLEALWDMTIEEDVVLKLVDLDVYEVFTESITKYEEDYRLIEILVGVIGNMCAVSEKAIENLCKNETAIEILLQLIGCGDSCVLIQLMRLITTIYGNIETAKIWSQKIVAYEEFVENFCFILSNSNNQLLLIHALEALNAILAKCASMGDFSSNCNTDDTKENSCVIIKLGESNLSTASAEAFRTFYLKDSSERCDNEPDEFLNTDLMTESLKKCIVIFLNIHDILLNYAGKVYKEDAVEALCTCLNIILNIVSKPNFVLPPNIEYLQDVLECLLSIYMASNALNNKESTIYVINLWWILKKHIEQKSNVCKEPLSDFESDDIELHESYKKTYNITEELLRILLKNCNESKLTKIFQLCQTEHTLDIFKLYDVKIDNYNEEEIIAYCHQLKNLFQSQKQ